jgi:beta-galactosidase
MFAVEVQDAAGRVVPVTDNEITFRVSGSGRLLGVGNGDPTSHESDIGQARRAFSGLCMAIVQSTKSPGPITVEANSPQLKSASVTITSDAVPLRPQVAAWERAVPTGPGITGLWRPAPSGGTKDILAVLFGGGDDTVFTLHQSGGSITGTVEAPAGFFGNVGSGPIEDGKISGANISFGAGGITYSGKLNGDHIELQQSPPKLPGLLSAPPSKSDKPRPVVGPPPDGTDPSFDMSAFGGQPRPPLILRRVTR